LGLATLDALLLVLLSVDRGLTGHPARLDQDGTTRENLVEAMRGQIAHP
jgi:hypothetical protein